jgi:hypothetical protein
MCPKGVGSAPHSTGMICDGVNTVNSQGTGNLWRFDNLCKLPADGGWKEYRAREVVEFHGFLILSDPCTHLAL